MSATRRPLSWHGPFRLGESVSLMRLALLASVLLLPMGGNSHWTAWEAFVLLLVAPLAEEVIFRLGLHQSLLARNVSSPIANLLVAVMFGLAHWVARGEITALLVIGPALLIGVAFERERRLAPCVCLHVLMNLIWLRLA